MKNKIINYDLKYINLLIMAIVAAFGLGHSINTGSIIVGIFCSACLIMSGWELFYGLTKTKEDNIKI